MLEGKGVPSVVRILGLSCFYHDSAVALVRDGEIVFAAQEERYSRRKHDARFPTGALADCLRREGVAPAQLDLVAFYEKPLLKFERILETYLTFAPHGFPSFLMAMPLWLKRKLWMKELILGELEGFRGRILFAEHHESHAASAFLASPFPEAAILTLDGAGEWTTTTCGRGRDNDVELLAELRFPHSLGLLYSAFTYFTGFRVNSAEYKVMGLAPYGEPKYVDAILSELVDLKDDGSLRMNMAYFDYCAGLKMTSSRFARLFGGPPRRPEAPLTQREMDLARSVQVVTEEAVLRMGRHLHAITGMKRLCLAGGVALNCVANGRLLREGPFEEVWIQPAAGDAGGALGAALLAWHRYLGHPRQADGRRDRQKGSYLGPEYGDEEIGVFLERHGLPHERLDPADIPDRIARLIEEQHVVGWLQGRMEFGPRALGARSILGDPRSKTMQSVMNLKIKFRESFRPFAPTALADRAAEYFDIDRPSPYMLLVAPVREQRRIAMTEAQEGLFGIDKLNVPRSDIPAVTHVDYSARLQTIAREDQPLYYDTIEAFRRRTGVGLVINTSFNVRGEPIVRTPEDAYKCFMRTEMDYLILGSFLLDKRRQPESHAELDWRQAFEPD